MFSRPFLACKIAGSIFTKSAAGHLPGGSRSLPSIQPCGLRLRLCSQQVSKRDVAAVEEAESMEGEQDKLYKCVEVEVRGHDPAVLRSYKWYATQAAKMLDITVGDTWEPKKVHHRLTLLKAPFSKKKHMVQYETRTYFQVVQLKHLTGSTADTYLEYIQRNLPEGVAMKVTKTSLEKLPDYIRPPAQAAVESQAP